MFTGLVEAVGEVIEISSRRLVLRPPNGWSGEVQRGESVAVDGCCLTAIPDLNRLTFDLSEETLRRTTLAELGPGSFVNLERSLATNGRLGGHFVLGHVDATATLRLIQPSDRSQQLTFEVDSSFDRYLVDKGSIALAGVSLTVVTPVKGHFDVWLIPETLERTTLGRLEIGQRLNVEFDILAKHVEKLLESRLG